MKQNKRVKLNTGCLKILRIIMLLYEDRAYYNDIIDIIKEGNKDQSTNNIQVTLNKYLNTLKVIGIKVIKNQNRYQLDSNLYSMYFSHEDLESIGIIIKSCENFPDKKVTKEILSFIRNLELRMSNKDKTKLYEITTKNDFSFYYSDMLAQIEDIQNICESDMVIDITFLKKGKIITIKGEPKEILYNAKNAYLRLYDVNTYENVDIPLQNIMNYHESPLKAKCMKSTTTVVFQLFGRLAKTYKLKEGEHIQTYENDILTVVNNDEPIDQLFSRLMRYSYNCKIKSPKFLKERMENLITQTLELYSED